MSIQSIMRRGYKRAVYDMLRGREPMGILEYTANVGRTKPTSRRPVEHVDCTGSRYYGQTHCLFGKSRKELDVVSVDGGYVTCSDGKRHRMSSVEFCW